MGISTADDLDARLLSIRSSWGAAPDETAYTSDVTALARDLEVRIGCDSLLKVAQVGLQHSSPPDTPAVAAPDTGFAGNSVVLATAPTRLDELAAGWDDDEVHSLLLQFCLADVNVHADANQAELLQIHLAFLARSDVRRQVGADRPVDLHVLAALTAERAAASMLSPVTFERDVEVALYRWLWGLLGAPEPVEHVDEVLARRDLRLQVQGQPVAFAAAQLSEVPAVTLLPFDASTDRLADPPLTLVDVRASARDLSQQSAAWAGRLRGLEQGERADRVDQAGDPYVMSGRALRWLLDRGIPILSLIHI